MAPSLLTLGHGTSPAHELAALIRQAAVEAILDVRKMPQSRRHPQFCREAMERWIPEYSGAAYRWEEALGGFRRRDPHSPNIALRHTAFRAYADYMESTTFALALAGLLAESAQRQIAILCSETLWWRCHRRLISDGAVLLHGAEVAHLMHDGKLRPHVATAGVRVTEFGILRYDVMDGVGDGVR